jgi:hypothetical protein
LQSREASGSCLNKKVTANLLRKNSFRLTVPNWLIKTAVHRAISWTPNRQFWNGLLQTYVTKSTHLTRSKFQDKVAEAQHHLRNFLSFHSPATDFSVFELGTGWLPIIPIGLYLCGAREIWTIDLEPLLRPAAVKQVIDFYIECGADGTLENYLPGFRRDRAETLNSVSADALVEAPAKLLARLNMHVLVLDAQKTPIPPGAVDFFLSSGVLEYIPRPVLQGILAESRRTAAPGAVMSHRLNLVDQYSYFDASITPFNFLRYTEKQWQWRNSPLIWQNRLRISDYRALVAEAGFELVREESTSGSAEELAKVKLAPQFGNYTREDLLVLHSFLTAKRASP